MAKIFLVEDNDNLREAVSSYLTLDGHTVIPFSRLRGVHDQVKSQQPDLLILDEPAMGLDLPSREDLLASIERLHKVRKVSVIYVTHHTEEITPMFTRIKIIADGRSFYAGSIKGGLKREILQKVFDHDVDIIELHNRYYTVLQDNIIF